MSYRYQYSPWLRGELLINPSMRTDWETIAKLRGETLEQTVLRVNVVNTTRIVHVVDTAISKALYKTRGHNND